MRRFRCRVRFHKWVRVKHEDPDLADPSESAEWRTVCRYCGVERRGGFRSTAALAGTFAVAGVFVWWLVSPVLGVLIVAGSILGLGWGATLTFIGGMGSFFRYRG